jgi:transposase
VAWQDHLPLYRIERIFGRQGLPLARSTICGWHAELDDLVRPLVVAMWDDAFRAPYLCADATGVLVQAKEKCRNGHFFVVAAPERHVLFAYTPKQNADVVGALLAGYKGTLVVDAHAVYNHLFESGDVVEAGCWAHARRYWWKALTTDPDRAHIALALIGGLFRIERAHATAPPEQRLAMRKLEAAPIIEKYFAWCDAEAERVLDETPSAKAIERELVKAFDVPGLAALRVRFGRSSRPRPGRARHRCVRCAIRPAVHYQSCRATISISMHAPRGRDATPIVVRAGYGLSNCCA